MDLAYICEWEKWPKSTHCPSGPLACTWSCRNLIAFTTDLRSDDQDLTRMIHILDTEHPWDVHSIRSEHSEAITCLEWDQSGSRLLSADADGQIKCWSMADHLANSWESPVGSVVEGDPIVALSWLHNGVKLALHVEKVDVLPGGAGLKPKEVLAPPLMVPGCHTCHPVVSICVASISYMVDVVTALDSCLHPTVQPGVPLRGEPPGLGC